MTSIKVKFRPSTTENNEGTILHNHYGVSLCGNQIFAHELCNLNLFA